MTNTITPEPKANQVTLESLRADYHTKIDECLFSLWILTTFNDSFKLQLASALEVARRTPSVLTKFHGRLERITDRVELPADLFKSAALLDVAEKQGLQAAMLYKLSDGAIDPRKDGAA